MTILLYNNSFVPFIWQFMHRSSPQVIWNNILGFCSLKQFCSKKSLGNLKKDLEADDQVIDFLCSSEVECPDGPCQLNAVWDIVIVSVSLDTWNNFG